MEVPRDRLQLRDDPSIISPPLIGPLYQCGRVVQVKGFITDATLDLEVGGVAGPVGVPAGFPEPNGAVVPLPGPLVAGQLVRVRQNFGGATSDWASATVRDHTIDYPAGPPRPLINPAGVNKCGCRTGVGNLLPGSNVWITAQGTEVGRVEGATPQQGVNVSPDYDINQEVVAWSELCGDPSPPSPTETSHLLPSPLPAPTFEISAEGSRQVVLNGLANGCRFTVRRAGVDHGPFRTWGGRTLIDFSAPISAFEVFQARQWLCPGDTPSPPGTTTAIPCGNLRAPTVAPIQDGDTIVTVSNYQPDAQIKVFANSQKVGDGSGPIVPLTRPIGHNELVHVFQVVGTCVGSTAQEIRSLCVAPPIRANPSWLNLFPVGFVTYDGGPIAIRTNNTRIHGTVYYPGDRDAEGAGFYRRLTSRGPVPIVFVVHGRHFTTPPTPSYLGYDYFQRNLAQMGIIAVSVDCVDTDGWGGGAGNINDRAQVILHSVRHFQNLNSSGDPIFAGRIDFSRVGLMGHSRGGDAVVTVPELPLPAGVAIQAVISLAPVNSGASSGAPRGYPHFLTILPAFDGDVVDLNGQQFYDRATNNGFRSQLFVENANHNFFNRQWGDDTGGGLPLMTRLEHEAILSAYGCALFRHALLAQNHADYFIGRALPAAVRSDKVQLSFGLGSGPLTVDHFEDRNGINQNSLGAPNTQEAGMNANEFSFAQSGASFNRSFFGNTTGMVAEPREIGSTFRFELRAPQRLGRREIWVRAAEVYNLQNVPVPVTSFELGIETIRGTRAWVDSNDVGGLSLVQDRRGFDLSEFGIDKTKTMPKTLRFPVNCFGAEAQEEIVALLIRFNQRNLRPTAFDDVQIV
jgi:hypothetical protein